MILAKKTNLYWLPSIGWMIVIFFLSSDLFASPHTQSIFRKIVKLFFPLISEYYISFLHVFFRKIAHMICYAILFWTYLVGLSRSFEVRKEFNFRKSLLAMGGVIFYASLDEWHQHFSSYRTGSIVDVGWDFLGAFTAHLFFRWKNLKTSKD